MIFVEKTSEVNAKKKHKIKTKQNEGIYASFAVTIARLF
jgi:hypothetical protein